MKNLVQTTGKFMLMDPGNMQIVPSQRPAVVEPTFFIQNRISAGALSVLGDVRDEATDEEFAKYWVESKGDAALAVESFKQTFEKRSNTEPKGGKKK